MSRTWIRATEIQGSLVTNPSGEALGEIKDFVLDKTQGRVGYAVLSFGGFLGLGEKLFALPWRALRY